MYPQDTQEQAGRQPQPNDPATHKAAAGVRETGSGDTTITYQHNLNSNGDENKSMRAADRPHMEGCQQDTLQRRRGSPRKNSPPPEWVRSLDRKAREIQRDSPLPWKKARTVKFAVDSKEIGTAPKEKDAAPR